MKTILEPIEIQLIQKILRMVDFIEGNWKYKIELDGHVSGWIHLYDATIKEVEELKSRGAQRGGKKDNYELFHVNM